MSIVGNVTKQPDEVDVYGIDYSEDMASTDAPASAYAFVLVKGKIGSEVAVPVSASKSTAFQKYILSAGAVLTLTGMVVGDRVYVVNKEAVTAATVGSADLVDGAATISLAAMHGRVLKKTAAGWVTEAEVRVIVDVSDKRVRNWLSGGSDGVIYKIETTTTSAEGRVLQDEIMVKVKES